MHQTICSQALPCLAKPTHVGRLTLLLTDYFGGKLLTGLSQISNGKAAYNLAPLNM